MHEDVSICQTSSRAASEALPASLGFLQDTNPADQRLIRYIEPVQRLKMLAAARAEHEDVKVEDWDVFGPARCLL